jgi:hypothetical protein
MVENIKCNIEERIERWMRGRWFVIRLIGIKKYWKVLDVRIKIVKLLRELVDKLAKLKIRSYIKDFLVIIILMLLCKKDYRFIIFKG